MIKKKVLLLGSSGQMGRHLVRKLTKNNYKVICQTRNSHKAVFLKMYGSIGYIDLVETNIFDEKIEKLISEVDICINLIGILYEKNKHNTFQKIHVDFPSKISSLCKKYNTEFIHFSALGIEKALDSKYAKSKLDGEIKIRENCPRATIIKPSLIFSVSDSLSTKFLSMLNLLPVFPLYYKGLTKFMPIHASDVAELTYHIISNEIYSKNIEAVGPEVLTFREILEILLRLINKKRLLVPISIFIGKITSSIFELLPNPLITSDQLKLLKYDNISSSDGISNFDINCPSKITFENGVEKYSYNWREGGKYSIKK